MEFSQLEGAFYNYMHCTGQVSPDFSREVLAFYTAPFSQCRRVLDVGCGEGQFVELLQSEGVQTVGIDMDAQMVNACREKGLNVVQADLFDYLPQHAGEYDGIFGSNLIEHLSAWDALRFIQLGLEALCPGGILLVATPNPESLIVHLNEFWRDATHIRLYDRSLLEFLLHWVGFEEVVSGENPHTAWTPSPAMQEVPRLLQEVPRLLQEVPCLLQEISSPRESMPWELTLPEVPDPELRANRPALRRLVFSLRRRLARFLAQTVLFEEFSTLNQALSEGFAEISERFAEISERFAELDQALSERFAELVSLSAATRQIEGAVYQTQSEMLLRPREIFVRGIKAPTKAERTP